MSLNHVSPLATAIVDENDGSIVYELPISYFQEKKRSICGCGLSQKMPFCDGSHKKANTGRDVKLKITEDGEHLLVRAKLDMLKGKVEADAAKKREIASKKWYRLATSMIPVAIWVFASFMK